MIRLQRVTFLALHNYLGLSQELINHVGYFENFHTTSIWCVFLASPVLYLCFFLQFLRRYLSLNIKI